MPHKKSFACATSSLPPILTTDTGFHTPVQRFPDTVFTVSGRIYLQFFGESVGINNQLCKFVDLLCKVIISNKNTLILYHKSL